MKKGKKDEKKTDAKKSEAKKDASKAPAKTEVSKTSTKPAEAKKGEKKSDSKAMQVEGKKRPAINKKGKIIKKRKAPTSKTMLRKWRLRNKSRVLETALADQFAKGRLYAKISSRPGQVGNADGYILEGEELAFYIKKLNLKKKK